LAPIAADANSNGITAVPMTSAKKRLADKQGHAG
jgi:hypothetical protein